MRRTAPWTLTIAIGLVFPQLVACGGGGTGDTGIGGAGGSGAQVGAGQGNPTATGTNVTSTGTLNTTGVGPGTTAAGPGTTGAGPGATTTGAGPGATTTTGAGPGATSSSSGTAATSSSAAGSSSSSAGMPRACAADATTISDFEENAAVVEPGFGNSAAQWYSYADTTGGTTLATEAKTPSAMCDKYDLHATATGHAMYVGFGATLNPNPANPMDGAGKKPEDFSKYTGVQFDIKANGTSGPIWFEFLNTENQPAANSGTAATASVDQYNTRGKLINPVPNAWTTVTVPFGTMGPRYLPSVGGTSGCPANVKCEAPAFNAASVLGFQFSMVNQFTPDPGSYNVSVDNVKVVTGNAGLPNPPTTAGATNPFPVDSKMVGSCAKPSIAAGRFLVDAYNKWKAKFVVAAGGGLRVQRPENNNDSVSEGIAYGMLISVFMNDKATFDGLYTYWNANKTAGSLMTWQIPGGTGSATDADEDAAFALLKAAKQWGGTYQASAMTMLNDIWTSDIEAGTLAIKGGSTFSGSGSGLTNPSYFAPAYYRVFATVDSGHNWMGVLNTAYTYLASITPSTGLVPAWCTNSCKSIGGGSYAQNNEYQYDAHRTPWRIGLDACWNNEPKAKTYVNTVTAFFNTAVGTGATGPGLGSLGDIYQTSGTKDASVSKANSMSLIGMMGVGAMAAGNTALATRAYQFILDATYSPDPVGATAAYTYFNATVGLMAALTMSGNFNNF